MSAPFNPMQAAAMAQALRAKQMRPAPTVPPMRQSDPMPGQADMDIQRQGIAPPPPRAAPQRLQPGQAVMGQSDI